MKKKEEKKNEKNKRQYKKKERRKKLPHLHPPLDRDLLHVPRPVRLAAERRVAHPDPRPSAAPEEGEVGDFQGGGAVEEVREVKVGRVVADDDVRVGLDDQVPGSFFWFLGSKMGANQERVRRREKKREETSFSVFVSSKTAKK